MTLAAFARNHGLSRQAASKWKAGGYLVIEDGLVIVTESDARLKAAGLGKYAGGNARPRSRPGALPQDGAGAVEAALDEIEDDPLDGGNLTRFVSEMGQGRTATLADAATIKENALALKHTLVALKLQKKLIDIDVAETLFFEEARAARDAWLNFPSRVGPLMAAELGIEPDRLVEVLNAHVHQQLHDLGKPEVDFGADEASAADHAFDQPEPSGPSQ
jgi:hypothetical protein